MPNNDLNIRVKKIISEFGLNQAGFSKRCGFGESQTRQFLKGADVGLTKVLMVIDAFPELNPMWIIKGESPMYKTQNSTYQNAQNFAAEKEFCTECYIKEGRIQQLEVFNQSLVKRNDDLSQEIGRLKGVIEDLRREVDHLQKDTG